MFDSSELQSPTLFSLFCGSQKHFSGEKIKADYLCSSLQDLQRELHTVPSCKHSCRAMSPQIPLQQPWKRFWPWLLAPVMCSGLLQLLLSSQWQMNFAFASSGNTLPFTSTMHEFIPDCFKSEEILRPLPLHHFLLHLLLLLRQQGCCCAS